MSRGMLRKKPTSSQVENGAVRVGLEHREGRPSEGKCADEREEEQDGPARHNHAGPAGDHHTTSVCDARRSMRMQTPSSTGNMKMPIAAPWARLPPWMPV